jgi:glycosyltransferase involved in cell wall biosynthesis
MTSFRPCVLLPTFDNPATIANVVARVRAYVQDVVIVDDGSAEPARNIIAELGTRGLAHVVRRAQNGGKGAAVKSGFRAAADLGYTHALQVDADGQHSVEDIPRFLQHAAANPECLVLGAPSFDASVPKARLYGRQLTVIWTHVETGGRVISDPMCGFRVYPLAAALQCAPRANRMDFDPEIAVRMVWHGTRVLTLPTHVRYVSREQGGVSHFQLVRDNLRITLMHTRLVCLAVLRLLSGRRLGLTP